MRVTSLAQRPQGLSVADDAAYRDGMSDKTPDGSTNLTDEQRAETADVSDKNQPDTSSGGAPESPDETTDEDGTPVENPSG
jgi:hypothetical protein